MLNVVAPIETYGFPALAIHSIQKWTFWTIHAFGSDYKALRIRNLQKIDRFRSKLVNFDLDKYTLAWTHKHTSLLWSA
jgi:hypothetical protein